MYLVYALDNEIRLLFFLAELQFCVQLEAFSSSSSFFKLKHRKPWQAHKDWQSNTGRTRNDHSWFAQCCSELKTIESIEAFSS